jgi:hypothetical protein
MTGINLKKYLSSQMQYVRIVVSSAIFRSKFRAVGSKYFVTTDFNPLARKPMSIESRRLGTYRLF